MSRRGVADLELCDSRNSNADFLNRSLSRVALETRVGRIDLEMGCVGSGM